MLIEVTQEHIERAEWLAKLSKGAEVSIYGLPGALEKMLWGLGKVVSRNKEFIRVDGGDFVGVVRFYPETGRSNREDITGLEIRPVTDADRAILSRRDLENRVLSALTDDWDGVIVHENVTDETLKELIKILYPGATS